eukprot:UN07381
MSSKYVGPPNDYSNLITSDLLQGCGTTQTKAPWIKASFNCVMNVTKIEIGGASREMAGIWGVQLINGAAIQYKDEGKWVTLIKLGGLHRNVIHQFNVNVETRELRVYRGGVIDLQYLGIANIRYLGIGCWRIFGVHINR